MGILSDSLPAAARAPYPSLPLTPSSRPAGACRRGPRALRRGAEPPDRYPTSDPAPSVPDDGFPTGRTARNGLFAGDSLPRPPLRATRKAGRPAWAEGQARGKGGQGLGTEMTQPDIISIRKISVSDRPAIGRVAGELRTWFTQAALDHIATDLVFQDGFVAELGGAVVGFVTFFVTEGVGHIGWIGVPPDSHRRGIGRQLAERVSDVLRENGVARLRVDTLADTVEYEPYERTRRFYRALGFVDVKGPTQEGADLLVLEKVL